MLRIPRVEGLAVDLAARICGLARPAQVLMSSGVADSARRRLDNDAFGKPIRWRTHGSYSLKGFDEALQIREAGLDGIALFEAPASNEKATPTQAAGLALTRKRTGRIAILAGVVLGIAVAVLLWTRASDRSSVVESGGAQTSGGHTLTVPGFGGRPAIAVLPFENRSDDPKQAIFADGLAEDLITRLSTWRAFPVIARGSSFHYRGDVDLKQVAKELAVQYVVQGSVRRVAERIRVTAQLIDAQSGENVWNQTYDRKVADVFELQDEISATIAASLVGDLTRAEAGRAQQRGTRNLEAWSLYELGLQHIFRLTPKDNAEARALLDQAVALEPKFATAQALLSVTYSWEVQLGSGGSPQDKLALALETARRAVELDPRDPMAHTALAFALNMSGDARNGLASAQRAVDLNPSSPEGWATLAWAKLIEESESSQTGSAA
jgi:adenylate cyclase